MFVSFRPPRARCKREGGTPEYIITYIATEILKRLTWAKCEPARFFSLLTPFYGYYMNNINVDISQPIWNMKFWNELPKDWNERVIFSHFDSIYSLCSQIITFNALYLTLFMKILNELPNRLNFGQLMSLKIWISKIRKKLLGICLRIVC